MSDFGSSHERMIRDVINDAKSFSWDGFTYKIILSGKPTVEGGGGETKTDIYVLAKRNDDKTKEFKISYKKSNYSFAENKIRKPRAEKIYGENWSKIIQDQIDLIKEKFTKQPLIYFQKDRKTCKGSVKLGWRYEMETKGPRPLGTEIDHNIAKNIWANKGADDKYRNGIINGEKIPESGSPNYFLDIDATSVKTADEIFSNLVPISEWLSENMSIKSAFLAQNYRTVEKKQEGNKRHLAVWVEWKVKDGKLDTSLVFDRPLEMESKPVLENFKNCIKKLGMDLDKNFDIENLRGKLSNNIPFFDGKK